MALITFGRLALTDASGQEVVGSRHRRKLELLAFLALADGPVSRDQMVDVFWDDERDERAARHSLSNALSFLRGVLERDAITAHRANVALVPGAVHVDAVELLSAARARNAARVVELHRGSFLDGLPAHRSPAFQAWVCETRRTIEQAVACAARVRCAATAAAHDWVACAGAARVWLRVDARSGDAALALINALRAPGTVDAQLAALAAHDHLATHLASLHAPPDPRVLRVVERLQACVTAERAMSALVAPPAISVSAASPSSEKTNEISNERPDPAPTGTASNEDRADAPFGAQLRARRRWSPRLAAAAGLAVAGALVSVVGLTRSGGFSPRPLPRRPVIAVTDVQDSAGDTSANWLTHALAQMLAADLARYATADVIEPWRIDGSRTSRAQSATPSESEAADLAREAGATLVVGVSLVRPEHEYRLTVVEQNVTSGAVIEDFTVTAADGVCLVDRAAMRLMAASPPSDPPNHDAACR